MLVTSPCGGGAGRGGRREQAQQGPAAQLEARVLMVSLPRFEKLTACEARGTDWDGANLTAAPSPVGRLTARGRRETDSDGAKLQLTASAYAVLTARGGALTCD
jgi:hypothetical protein